MHATVLRKGENIKIVQCISCCDKYHCPFCKTWVYKPVDLYSVKKNVEDHLKTAVQEEDFIIIRCNLKCRDVSHFHCCYCSATIIRKAQFNIHLTKCKQKKQKIPSPQRTATPMVLIGNTPLPSASAQTAPLLQPQPSPSEPHTSVSPTPSTPLYQPKIFKGPELPSPLSTFTPLPSASAQTAPLLQPQPSPSEPHTSVSPKHHVRTGSKQIREKCIHCGIKVNKKNLRLHIKRKHTDVKQMITSERHFLSQCIDSENGIFAVQKSFFGPSLPIQVLFKY
ncbi:uncharacterized protein LOC127161002 [Labeo rohita]|uniref:uncharacterized protein LOC127161002 n=1 Tax=Labeo rohita TaxID=84645 RepID=UPI0021E1E039|nr:uncharacterized protein LOC127161002 [Labeo rohita]